jgi:hypothetical protein
MKENVFILNHATLFSQHVIEYSPENIKKDYNKTGNVHIK